jgi:hypothetical protein
MLLVQLRIAGMSDSDYAKDPETRTSVQVDLQHF